MKIFSRFFGLLLVVAMVSCDNNVDMPTPDNEVDIPLDPSKHYIHFDADVATRGALIEGDILSADFSVLGYQYPGEWAAEKVFAIPNVFDSTPQLVKFDRAVFSYGTPKKWTGNTYSFFGYYPASHSNIVLTATQGDPYITYTLPTGNDATKLIDVMTASYIDTGVASSSSVAMEFRHRLSAIDIGARNYYEYNHDHNSVTPVKLVTIEITELTVNLNNIVNESAKIYLDHTIPSVYPENQARTTRVYSMVDKNTTWATDTFDVMPNTASNRNIQLITNTSGDNASSILLIPQTELVEGTLALTYRRKYQDDNGTWLYQKNDSNAEIWTELPTAEADLKYYEFNPIGLDINFSKSLIEGRRYYIELTFTSDAVSVNIVAADEWDELKDDIDYEFE